MSSVPRVTAPGGDAAVRGCDVYACSPPSQRPPPRRADHATWWRLPAASDPQQSSLLMAAVFHLSSGPDIAWGCLSHALWHGMASTLPLQLGTP